jgi:NAD(P)-dependent dehydrogenase (short-subunit alcohol dehydrogenase family)
VAELADAQDLKSCGPQGPCGIVPHPRHQYSTKTFVALSQALHEELKPDGVRVQAIVPGRDASIPDTLMSAPHHAIHPEVGDHGTHLDPGQRRLELLEAIAAPTYCHEVIAFGAKSEREGTADAGGRADDDRQSVHAVVVGSRQTCPQT